MFDPLDLYEDVKSEHIKLEFSFYQPDFVEDKKQDIEFEDDLDDDIPICMLDLPATTYAPPELILTVLRLLKPDQQVNFESKEGINTEEICQAKSITDDLKNLILDWYTNKFHNQKLDTLDKICIKIPALMHSSETERQSLLNYYTSILKKYENSNSSQDIKNDILKEVSLRISECCGRTAQPSMNRIFKFENMKESVTLYEPSLTADNLGWKTWGASLILSKILINNFESCQNINKQDEKLRVLELGSGTGLVGISWACKWKELYGSSNKNIDMYVTDLPEIAINLKKNVLTNKLNEFVTADVLDWTNPSDFVDRYSIKDNTFDIILIADPIYSPNHPEWVVNMIKKFLSPNGKCYLDIPIRPKYAKERQIVIELLSQHGFKLINERYDDGIDDWGSVKYLYREIIYK